MTRFREEHYATKAFKAEVSRRRRGEALALEGDERPCRSQYFKNSPEARKAIHKAQKRLNGF